MLFQFREEVLRQIYIRDDAVSLSWAHIHTFISRITCPFLEERPNVFIIILRDSDMMVFLKCLRYYF